MVYRDEQPKVYLEHPYQGSLTADIYRGGRVVRSNAPVTSVLTVHELQLTYEDTQYDGELTIVWKDAGSFERKTTVSVVSPIVRLSKLQTLFAPDNKTEAALSELESSVRLIIEAYTGHKFEYFKGIINVQASNGALALPSRLINVYSIPGLASYRISPNGRYVYASNDQWLTVKQAPPEEFSYVANGVIHVPGWFRRLRGGTVYSIHGEWGYIDVPDDVQEAALLLANDYACNDGIYRDRYIDSVTTELTNYRFRTEAFTGTGNVRADMLLSKYKSDGLAWL